MFQAGNRQNRNIRIKNMTYTRKSGRSITIKRDYKLVEWDDLHRDVQHQLQDVYAACMTYIFDIEGDQGYLSVSGDRTGHRPGRTR